MGYEISDTTVGNILRAHIIPAPERGRKSNWKQFVRSHIFLGEKPLRRAVEQYVKHYHHERNHQGIDNLIPFPESAGKPDKHSAIPKSERLGGLLNYYHREKKEVSKVA